MIQQPFRDECNNSRLRAFLDDGLPEPENVHLADHLNHCEDCRRTLERLAAGSRLWAELREAIPASRPVPPAQLNEPHGTLPHGAPPAEGDISLDFLQPSSRAGSLGRLGSYEVTGVLGRGGFGIVLKACDPALNRTVAIKILAPQLAVSGVARSRFAREARAAAAVIHDNVVAIHNVDSFNGLPYLVMPFITGLSLQHRVDRDGPLAIKEVLRIGMQSALGLAAAHGQGLVHRDVKPSNILLENGVERVNLCDFGMARAVDDASLTQSGVVSGTPQYMSPEQARGEAIDHRSDLFSLGGVLYFMCAGHAPFRADSTPAVLRRVCDDTPRSVREINSDVPVWLAKIVERLHAKEPNGRFETATEVAEVLQHHLAELQLTGTSAPLRPISQAPVRIRSGRKPIAAILLASAVLIAAITGGYSIIPSGEQSSRSAGGDPVAAPIVGSGRSASKSWDIADFTEVKMQDGFQAEITKGDGFKVTTSSDDNLTEHIQVFKEGNTLTLRLAPKVNVRRKLPFKAEIVLPTLAALTVHDGSKAVLKGFRSEKNLKLALHDGGTIEGAIDVGRADFEVHDGSTLALTGTAKEARLLVQDGSHLKLQDLVLKQCTINLGDASDAVLNVRSDKPFSATVTDSSSLNGSVDAGSIELKLGDASRAKLRGSARNANIRAGDSCAVDLSKLSVDDAEIMLSESSRATMDVRKSLKYVLSSDSHLEYSGNPTVLTGSKARGATIRRLP